MSTSGSAVAGWYPDPSNPAQLRWWDGTAWTGNIHATPALAAPVAQPGYGPGPGPVPGPGVIVYGAQPGPVATGPALGDIGSWLGETFRALFARVVPVLLLLFAVPAVGVGLATWVGLGAIVDLTIDKRADRVYGAALGPALVGAAILVVTVLLGAWGYLAAYHQLYRSHIGRPASLGRSLAVGLKRFPRAVLWGFVYFVVVGLAVGVLYGLPIVLVAVTGEGGFLALYFAFLPILVVVALWLGTRLAFLFPAVALSPAGSGPWSTTLRLTKGRFWGVLGRLVLLVLIAGVAAGVIQVALQLALQVGIVSLIKVDPVTGNLIINGHDLDAERVIRIGDLLPNRAALAAGMAVYAAAQAIQQSVLVSGLANLYHRLAGPADED